MEVNQEYVFLVLKEARKLEFNQNTGERVDVPVMIPLVVARGRVVKRDDGVVDFEDGSFLPFNSFFEAVPAKLFDERLREGVKSVEK